MYVRVDVPGRWLIWQIPGCHLSVCLDQKDPYVIFQMPCLSHHQMGLLSPDTKKMSVTCSSAAYTVTTSLIMSTIYCYIPTYLSDIIIFTTVSQTLAKYMYANIPSMYIRHIKYTKLICIFKFFSVLNLCSIPGCGNSDLCYCKGQILWVSMCFQALLRRQHFLFNHGCIHQWFNSLRKTLNTQHQMNKWTAYTHLLCSLNNTYLHLTNNKS